VLARSDGNDTAGFIDVGINSNTYAQAAYSLMTPSSGYMFTNGGDLFLGTQTLHNIVLFTGNTTTGSARVVVSNNGNMMVGTTTAGADKRLIVDATTNMHAVSALSNTSSYATLEVINTDTASTRFFQVFRTARGTGTIGSITGDTSGTGTTYNTTSDYRLKTNVQPITDGKERVLKLQPVRHGWTANNEVVVDGFLAHQAQESGFEYAVAGEKDGDVMQSMDYGRISPAIVAALHDAFAEIAELRNRIKELENK
jgi:hypothetical protein